MLLVHDLGAPADEYLPDSRLDLPGMVPYCAVVHGNIPPSKQQLSFFLGNALNNLLTSFPLTWIPWKKDHTDPILTRRWEPDTELPTLLAEELMGHLEENAGPISRFRISSTGSAMAQIDQDLKSLHHNIMGLASLDVGDDSHPTAIMLVLWVVKTLFNQWC
jgi:hypothetical protein